jgi:hypothetical protein
MASTDAPPPKDGYDFVKQYYQVRHKPLTVHSIEAGPSQIFASTRHVKDRATV